MINDDFDFNLDEDTGKHCQFEDCEDPTCVYCQTDDAEAAFWDEFMSDPAEEMVDKPGYLVYTLDDDSGEELILDNLNIKPYTILKWN